MSRVRPLPVTACYFVVLVATTITQYAVSPATRHRLLLGSSTDVAHLVRDPALVLVASAFWLPDLTSLLLCPLIVLVLAVAEQRFGAARVVVAFVAGHVVSTLLTEGSVGLGVHLGWLSSSHDHRLDVGPSYGAAAVLGLLVAGLPVAQRRIGVLALAVLLGLPLAVDSELTTVGHIVGAATGVALWQIPWFRRARHGRAESPTPYRRGCSSVSRC